MTFYVSKMCDFDAGLGLLVLEIDSELIILGDGAFWADFVLRKFCIQSILIRTIFPPLNSCFLCQFSKVYLRKTAARMQNVII